MSETTAVPVHPTNTDALRAWDGADGAYWVEHEARFDRAVARYRDRFFAAAAITPGERVLDIGCGTGDTTRDAARLCTPGVALGVDLGGAMLDRARARANEDALDNARFEQADAQIHAFEPATFDVAISRTGAMFFGDPIEAFTNIARALRPGGRLVLLVWQPPAGNEWFRGLSRIVAAGRSMPGPPPDAPGPFSLADPDRTRALLTNAGFTGIELEGAQEPMWFGTDAGDAYDFLRGLGFTEFMLRDLDDDARDRALTELRAFITEHETGDGVEFDSAVWIVTARRA
jgi:SAM-dependent methyltransferase